MNTITVNGNVIEWFQGMTVNDVLRIMNYTFRMLVIKIDGQLVPKDSYATQQIPTGAEVYVIHLISGG